MPPRYFYRDANGSNNEISDYFRLYKLDVITNAEEGSVGTSTIYADDPNATLDIVGHQRIVVTESEAFSSNTTTYVGFTADRVVKRGDYYRTGAGRVWDINLTDLNTVIGRRVMVGTDGDRPAETDIARVQWALSTNEAGLIDDQLFLSVTDPVDMDAVDYQGQTLFNIFDDAAQQSGKNWFVWYREETGQFSFWYDFASASNFTSPLRLTNVLSDIDSTWTFAISDDTQLRRDPSRVFSGVYVPYDGGAVYAQSYSTASNFARRDSVMPAVNVKSASKAKARAQRYLESLDTEEDVVTTTFVVPLAKVNFLLAGMRVRFKATHLPGYEDWVWMRCLNREVTETSEEFYSVKVDLVAPVPAPTPQPVYGILYGSGGPYSSGLGNNLVYWANPGDTPGPGYEYRPTSATLTVLTDSTPPKTSRTHYGFRVNGAGTINVVTFLTVYGILLNNIAYTWTAAILKNGVIVASETFSPTPGNLKSQGWDVQVQINNLSVVDGDVISTLLDSSPSWPAFFRTPRGTGQNGERLEITGGSIT